MTFKECEAAGGTASISVRSPQAAGEEWRLTGVACTPTGQSEPDIQSFPTTMDCYNLAWTQPV
jgi:hypothetical protein